MGFWDGNSIGWDVGVFVGALVGFDEVGILVGKLVGVELGVKEGKGVGEFECTRVVGGVGEFVGLGVQYVISVPVKTHKLGSILQFKSGNRSKHSPVIRLGCGENGFVERSTGPINAVNEVNISDVKIPFNPLSLKSIERILGSPVK